MTLEEQTGAYENSWCQHITGKAASISQCLSSFDICAPASMLPAVVTTEPELCLANDSQTRASNSPLYPASQPASLLAALWSNLAATHLPTQPGLLTASATKSLYQMLFGGFCVSHLNVQDLLHKKAVTWIVHLHPNLPWRNTSFIDWPTTVRVRNGSRKRIKDFQVWGQGLGDESLVEEEASVGGCYSALLPPVDYRQYRNANRLPCNAQEVKQITEPKRPQHDS